MTGCEGRNGAKCFLTPIGPIPGLQRVLINIFNKLTFFLSPSTAMWYAKLKNIEKFKVKSQKLAITYSFMKIQV